MFECWEAEMPPLIFYVMDWKYDFLFSVVGDNYNYKVQQTVKICSLLAWTII